jgi:hypothetical protein
LWEQLNEPLEALLVSVDPEEVHLDKIKILCTYCDIWKPTNKNNFVWTLFLQSRKQNLLKSIV